MAPIEKNLQQEYNKIKLQMHTKYEHSYFGQKCKASGKLDSNSDWDHPPMPYAVKIINNYRKV